MMCVYGSTGTTQLYTHVYPTVIHVRNTCNVSRRTKYIHTCVHVQIGKQRFVVCGVATCHIVITCTYRPRSVHVLHIHDIHTCTRLTAHVYMVLFVIIMQYLYSIYMYPTRSTLGGGTYVDSKMLLFTALIKSDSRLQCMYV